MKRCWHHHSNQPAIFHLNVGSSDTEKRPKRNSQRRVPSIMAMRVLAVLAFFVPAYAFVAPAGVRPVSTESVHAASYAPDIRIVWWLNVFVSGVYEHVFFPTDLNPCFHRVCVCMFVWDPPDQIRRLRTPLLGGPLLWLAQASAMPQPPWLLHLRVAWHCALRKRKLLELQCHGSSLYDLHGFADGYSHDFLALCFWAHTHTHT